MQINESKSTKTSNYVNVGELIQQVNDTENIEELIELTKNENEMVRLKAAQ